MDELFTARIASIDNVLDKLFPYSQRWYPEASSATQDRLLQVLVGVHGF
jgi:hypothetical protein